MPSSGITFEQLVHQVETLLLRAYGLPESNVQTAWRYRVRGKDSGELREVDVAIFVDVGIRKLFIAIECRDRKGRQGVDWIEQLARKRQDIEADRMVAVSRDGFSEKAVEYARQNSIEVYTLSDCSPSLAQVELIVSRPQFRLLRFAWSRRGMVLDPREPVPQLSDAEVRALTSDFGGENWFDRQRKKLVSFREVLSESLTWEKLVGETVDDGLRHEREVATEPDTGRIVLARDFPNGAMIELARVVGEFEVWWEQGLVPAERVVQYRAADGEPIVEIHEYDGAVVGLDGQTLVFAPIRRSSI